MIILVRRVLTHCFMSAKQLVSIDVRHHNSSISLKFILLLLKIETDPAFLNFQKSVK